MSALCCGGCGGCGAMVLGTKMAVVLICLRYYCGAYSGREFVVEALATTMTVVAAVAFRGCGSE